LLLPRKEKVPGRFNMPYINAQYIFPVLITVAIVILVKRVPDYFPGILNFDFSGNADYAAGKASFMDLATYNISHVVFWLACIVLAALAFIKKYSLIPLMGVSTCLYLLTGMTKSNWAWFLSWLGVGLIIYFIYGYNKSKLAAKK